MPINRSELVRSVSARRASGTEQTIVNRTATRHAPLSVTHRGLSRGEFTTELIQRDREWGSSTDVGFQFGLRRGKVVAGVTLNDQALADLALYGPSGTKDKVTRGFMDCFNPACLRDGVVWGADTKIGPFTSLIQPSRPPTPGMAASAPGSIV